MLALLNLLTANVLSFTQYPSASRKLSALHTLLHSHTYNTHSTQFLVCKDQFSKASEHHGWQHWRHCQEGLGRYLEETQGQDLRLQQCKYTFLCIQLAVNVKAFCVWQDLGSNYYQPMIKYINQKDIYGPYMEKKRVELPDRPEVSSNKYSNM